MTAYLSRFVCLDVESNLRRAEEEARRAADAGAKLVVFPEAFLHGYSRLVDPAIARAVFQRASGAYPGSVFAFGSFTEARRNRMTVWRAGREIARYDKVHLFAPNREENLWDPGDRYAAVRLGRFTLGLMTCNDIRFPEQARTLRLAARCDALLVVAWWPWRRDHVWRTLLQARAIENATWVLGCSVAASEHPDERFAGAGNYVFDPRGEPVTTGDDHRYELELDRTAAPLVDTVATYRDVSDVEVFEAGRADAPSAPERVRSATRRARTRRPVAS